MHPVHHFFFLAIVVPAMLSLKSVSLAIDTIANRTHYIYLALLEVGYVPETLSCFHHPRPRNSRLAESKATAGNELSSKVRFLRLFALQADAVRRTDLAGE
jgi:hypothetical protein